MVVVIKEEEFREGEEVEIISSEDWDSWFKAKILKVPSRKAKKSIFVEYERSLVTSGPLRKCYVSASLVRPLPPAPKKQVFGLNQLVDALFNGNRWCRGKIIKILDYANYTVHFTNFKKEKALDFEVKELRVHQEWFHGKWLTSALPQHQEIETEYNQDVAIKPQQHSIKRTDQKLCSRSGARWGCSVIALPGNIYCEKHRRERDIYNARRNKGTKKLCSRSGARWGCSVIALPGNIYCEKHRRERDIYNARRNKGTKKLCSRSGARWGCSAIALPGNIYCEKHRRERDVYNAKRNKRTKKLSDLFNGDDSTSLSRTGEEVVHAKPNQGDVRKTDQAYLSQVRSTVERIYTRKRKINKSPLEPCKKLKEGEVTEDSLSLLVDPKRTIHTSSMTGSRRFSDITTTTRKVEEAVLGKKKDASPNFTDTLSSPLERLNSDNHTPSISQTIFTSVLDCGRSGNFETSVEFNLPSLSKIKRAEGDWSKTQGQVLQKYPVIQSSPDNTKSLVGDEIIQQKGGLGNQTTDILETGRQSKEIVLEASSEIGLPNRLESLANMAITLTEASMKGHEVERPLYVAKCSMSLGEQDNAIDHLVVEDGHND